MLMSRTSTSGERLAVSSTACAPSLASPTTTKPDLSRRSLTPSRNSAWSSASRTRVMFIHPARERHAEASPPAEMLCNWKSGSSGLDHAAQNGVSDQARNIVDAEPLHNPCSMRFGGFDTQIQHRRDTLGRVPFSNQLQHLPFTICQQLY